MSQPPVVSITMVVYYDSGR